MLEASEFGYRVDNFHILHKNLVSAKCRESLQKPLIIFFFYSKKIP